MPVAPPPRRRLTVLVAAVVALATAGSARADRVELDDGRVLEGRFAMLPGVVIDPLAEPGAPAFGPILVCDDGLTRTMVSKRRVVATEPGPSDLGMERLVIPQRVADSGRRVIGIGSILEATPFDEFGRRILSLATAGGRVDVVQGITEITPRWVRLEGLRTDKPLVLDMRLATTSIPRESLRRVIARSVDPRDPEQRLRLVRLLMQGERYDEAGHELDELLAEFPDLADLGRERRSLARLASARLFDEILLRGRSGQDRLALHLLESFPADDADGEILEAVRETRDDYLQRRERAAALVATARQRVAALSDDTERAAAEAVLDEVERELSFATLPRLTTFERLGADAALPADRAVALAINGWLGTEANGDNLKVALSAVRVRGLVRDYLRSADDAVRADIVSRLGDEEASGAATVAAVAGAMRPPFDPPNPVAPGRYDLVVPGPDGTGGGRCVVQVPPEYDPLRRYPAVVALHGEGSTPLLQVDWWCGMPGPDGTRQGQAARNGSIVIAPAWAAEHQSAYGATAREHAAVLAAMREAVRHFAIDTDRVFLAGHAMGGDAAWDIALAHPDLWAGLVAITPTADRYVTHYWQNSATLPVCIVGGELDGGTLKRNAAPLDRAFLRGYDLTYVEYRGRGHEHFSDEILRLFDWMRRKTRTPFPTEIEAVTMRPWDRFFWWLEVEGAPPRTVVLPNDWPPPTGTRPLSVDAKVGAANRITARCGTERVRVWLSPELIDFAQPVSVTIDGRTLHRGPVVPDLAVLLDDLRLRGDRQHPFWAVVELSRPPKQ
jgi:predicted esterase